MSKTVIAGKGPPASPASAAGDAASDAAVTSPGLSVVVPVYNEADNILPLAREIFTGLAGVGGGWEVIFVDDCSTDRTPERLREARTELGERLRVVIHKRNFGQSTAIRTGVRAARAAWVATLDGDGQNDPADIPRLLALRDEPGQTAELRLVCGYRRRRRDTWLKRLSSRIANGVRSRLLGDRTPDTGCGLKLIQRQAFLALPNFDHMHRFLPALVQRDGGAVVSVEVNHRPRSHGVSKYGLHNRLWVGIVDMFWVLWLKRRARIPHSEEIE